MGVLPLSVAAAMTGNFFKNKVDRQLLEYGDCYIGMGEPKILKIKNRSARAQQK